MSAASGSDTGADAAVDDGVRTVRAGGRTGGAKLIVSPTNTAERTSRPRVADSAAVRTQTQCGAPSGSISPGSNGRGSSSEIVSTATNEREADLPMLGQLHRTDPAERAKSTTSYSPARLSASTTSAMRRIRGELFVLPSPSRRSATSTTVVKPSAIKISSACHDIARAPGSHPSTASKRIVGSGSPRKYTSTTGPTASELITAWRRLSYGWSSRIA